MPPSPSSRISPARDTTHKRGRSFGSGLPLKPKDDDLALFSDMQRNERENFLLQPSEDFEESLSKLRYFSDFKLGVNIPPRGETSDLLNTNGDKNDYDWLLTPPDTPLFRSLDDEEHQPICQAPRGRPQSKPISISRSSTMERAQRSTRSSASPNRLSLSPHSSSSVVHPRTRPSTSSSRGSPPPVVRPSTPSRRPCTPPATKSSTPTRRSSSPAPRRMSSGSGCQPLSHGTRGTSPVKANRGTSASPKLRGWQSNLPGFSSDAPPNLRTSLPDRPVLRSRGVSPVSGSGLDSASRGRRQSMSPTPSRSASSSHSNERDRFSSYSRASAASSGEDDVDSMQSMPMGYSGNTAARKNLAVMKSRTIASSKKPSKSFSPSSAPKRSFDSAVWLMDHRKAPQNMFRPLLSSVPATTLTVGKINNVHRPMFSRNSSVTTSSNASSEHGAIVAPYMDNDRHDPSGEWEAAAGSDLHEEMFMFDKMDELNEDSSHEYCASTTQSGTGTSNECMMNRIKCLENTTDDFDVGKIGSANWTSHAGTNDSGVGCSEMATCSRCGKLFNIRKIDQGGDVCEECALRDGKFSAEPRIVSLEETHHHDITTVDLKPCDALQPPAAPISTDNSWEASLDRHTRNDELPATCLPEGNSFELMVDTSDGGLLEQRVDSHTENRRPQNNVDLDIGTHNEVPFPESSGSEFQQTEPTASAMEQGLLEHQMDININGMQRSLLESDGQSNLVVSKIMNSDKSHQTESIAPPVPRVDNTEGTGISVLLLQKSGSSKWPVLEGRALSATNNIHCSEPYYARDNMNVMKRSIGRDSSSAASSVDLGSSRQAEVRFQRIMSGRRGDFDKAQFSSTISAQSTGSVSDMSISGSSAPLFPQNDANEDICYSVDSVECKAPKMLVSMEECERSCRDAMSTCIECSSTERAIVNEDSCIVLNALCSNRLSKPAGDDIVQDHTKSIIVDEDTSSPQMSSPHIEVQSKGCLMKTEDVASGAAQCSIGIPEHPSDENSFENSQKQSQPFLVLSDVEKLENGHVSISEEDALVSAAEPNRVELPNGTYEELASTAEGPRKPMQRSFTLEEATGTILFCSSIIHDLAYKAATIGLEREQEQLLEPPRPTVTIVGKSISREDNLPKMASKRTPNTRKVKRKRLEAETITQPAETEEIAKGSAPVNSASEVTRTSDSMKPPKLESKCNCTIM